MAPTLLPITPAFITSIPKDLIAVFPPLLTATFVLLRSEQPGPRSGWPPPTLATPNTSAAWSISHIQVTPCHSARCSAVEQIGRIAGQMLIDDDALSDLAA